MIWVEIGARVSVLRDKLYLTDFTEIMIVQKNENFFLLKMDCHRPIFFIFDFFRVDTFIFTYLSSEFLT